MNEGWYGDDYLILFAERETEATQRYGALESLPGYEILGLLGWDDFLVRDAVGSIFRVPTVPLDARYLSPYLPSWDVSTLLPDERFRGKVKWYTKPIVFGGDANAPENLTWVDHAKHAELVQWWNALFRSIRSKEPTR